jgi:transposase InsO family protein
VSQLRFALCHADRTCGRPVAAAAREFHVSRKTAHKWLKVFDDAAGAAAAAAAASSSSSSSSGGAAAATAPPRAEDLADRSRRPRASPARTPAAVEADVLAVRDRFGCWGGRKIRAYLVQQAARDGRPPPPGLPSVRTVDAVLSRHGRVSPRDPTPPAPPQRFERDAPNRLWQLDHKGGVEVARRKLFPFAVIDDHSRYLLAFEPLPDKTMARCWDVLWGAFEQAGLPEQVLCDNAFNTMGLERPVGLSWFDARLVRLGIDPIHGGPYHPQTQGKVERLNGSAAAELIFFNARRDSHEHFAADCRRWRDDYNALRPHQAIGDLPPVSRWRPSTADRPRPAALPDPASYYPPGAELRKVCQEGLVRVDGYRILVGRGIGGQMIRVERRDAGELAILYCRKQVRLLSHDQLLKDKVL